jgi:FAD/FMN-containing dehydrogenase
MLLIQELKEAFGPDSIRTGSDIPMRNRADASGAASVCPLALILPRTTQEVSLALALANAHGCPVVPQGGMTGLVGGATPGAGELALSLERMNGVEEVDVVSGTITALAGTPLQVVQDAAEAAGFLLGIDLGARGTCTIGGNVATNAGGNQVLRYGMTRANLRGIEAVLADGRIVRSMNKMMKNNTGYDWTQLLVGSEGTLGIVTRVTLALHPRPPVIASALVKVTDTEAALALLRDLGRRLPGGLMVFEAMWDEFYSIATGKMGLAAPLEADKSVFLLIEAAEAGDAALQEVLGECLAAGAILDAVISQSEATRRRLWALRESVYEHARYFPPAVGFDISIPLDRIAAAVQALRTRIASAFPDAAWVVFGHLADSNLHVNIMAEPAGPATRKTAESVVYGVVSDFGGSVSAEHGIGRAKVPFLHLSRSAPELGLMAEIKTMMDPKGILSPGRIFKAP